MSVQRRTKFRHGKNSNLTIDSIEQGIKIRFDTGEFQMEKNRLTVTFNPMFVQREALVTLATETSNGVLASSVQAHPWKLDALVHVLLIREPAPPWTQFLVRVGPRLRTRFASLAAPRTAHGTTAQTLGKLALDRIGALAVSIIQVTGLLPRVYARDICAKRLIVERKKRILGLF